MQFTILRMLSSASLAAFTASVQARASGVSPVRGQTEARPGNAAGAPGLQLAPLPARPPADRNLPRGSLLDLSV